MPVIVVKLIMVGSGSGGGVEELAGLGPGEFLVAGVVDGLGQELLGLGDEAGQGVQVDGGVAEPVGGAQPGEGVDRLGEDGEAVVAGGGCGLLAGTGQAQLGAVHEASWLIWASSEANSCPRWSWCLAMASWCWACRVGRNSMLV